LIAPASIIAIEVADQNTQEKMCSMRVNKSGGNP